MFQLYKSRNFNEIIGDTFNFFKAHGKNYFANYIAINGGVLLILILLLYFFIKIFYDALFTNGGVNNNNAYLESYMQENLPFFIGYGIGAFILILILTFISHLYPIAYLKLIEKNEETNTKNLWKFIQSKLGRSFIFFFLTGITMLPVCLVLLFLCFLLFFLIVGLPLLVLLMPAIFICMSFAYYNYINTNDGYFTSIQKGYMLFMKKPWPLIGSTFLIYMIVNTVVTTISFIPYFAGIFSLLFNIETQNPENLQENFSFIMIMVGLTFILSITLNYLLQNIIFVNQGIMYYTMIDETENTSKISEIDTIGNNEE